ncbi:MAG: membrane integrity-associated transporter subunit PqiC [Gammaproteobacteria bacterium]|nr:membrane integrity-associated transporter subunit PqiC [Gammaproteobacteria bacterium]
MEKPINHKNYVLAVIIILMLTGCSGGSTSIRYFMIDSMDFRPVSDREASGLVIEIMDVNIPQYMERFNIVSRGNTNQLYFSENNQWGDNFRKNLLRTMAQNLSNLLGTDDVGTPINRTLSNPDYRLQVHIEQFERNYDGYVTLITRWQVLMNENQGQVSTHRAELISNRSYTMEDYENIVAAMKELYGELGQLIAESIPGE